MSALTTKQKKTFADLRKQTMSLIQAFYGMPEYLTLFEDMMAIYEANPTANNAKAIFDKVMGDDSAEDKKKWILENVKKVPQEARDSAKKKYIDGHQPVPKGVPVSGMLLVGLGVVSKEEKDILMEAQAAARIIAHVDVLDKYTVKTNYKNPDGTFENNFLDKSFATKIQRLEHVVNAVVNDTYTQVCNNPKNFEGVTDINKEEEIKKSVTTDLCKDNLFLQKARNEALNVLAMCAEQLKSRSPQIAAQIDGLRMALDGRENVEAELEKMRATRFDALIKHVHNREESRKTEDFYNKEIKHLEIAREAKNSLRALDFKKLRSATAGRPIECLIEHRIGQILSTDPAYRAMMSKDKTRG